MLHATILIENCEFFNITRNNHPREFPVIKMSNVSKITIEKCRFINNSGIAVDVEVSEHFKFILSTTDCVFAGNRNTNFYYIHDDMNTQNTTAISSRNQSLIILQNVTVASNQNSDMVYLLIWFIDISITIKHCRFIHNGGKTVSGRISKFSNFHLLITNTDFRQNQGIIDLQPINDRLFKQSDRLTSSLTVISLPG